MKFNAESTAAEVLEGHDLTNKRVLITGCSGGIGFETARTLVQVGANLVMANRESGKSQEAYAKITQEFPDADITQLDLDLSSLASVRAFTDKYKEKYQDLHLLINNAGVMACPQGKTHDGFETQFGVNHLGHFVLTCRLADLLIASAPARVVNVSSAAHRRGTVNIEDPNFENREYDKWESYGQSKTANVLFSLELNNRLENAGVKSYSVHPGMIFTDLSRHLSKDDVQELEDRFAANPLTPKSVEAGASTSVWAATAEELEAHGGVYLEDCSVAKPNEGEHDNSGYSPHAKDEALAKQLWDLSEELVAEKFPLSSN